MRTNTDPRQRLTSDCSWLLARWCASNAGLAQHPHGRYLAEVGLHAVLTGLRCCRTSTELCRRHFDRASARADLVLLASLLLPTVQTLTTREEAQPLLLVREAAFWCRWCELQHERR